MRMHWTIFACWIAVLIAAPARAVDRSSSLAELKHDSFTLDGGLPTTVEALAQSADGYLWIGTVTGLYRFDGVTFERFTTEPDNSRSEEIGSILASRSGPVWFGHVTGGISVFVDGQMRDPGPGAPVEHVVKIVQSTDGSVWVATTRNNISRLRRYSAGRWAPAAADLVFKGRLGDVLAGPKGTLLAIVDGNLLLVEPGQRRQRTLGRVTSAGRLAAGPDGTIWLVDRGAVRVVDPRGDPARAGLGLAQASLPAHITDQRIIVDRQGVLWSASPSLGLLRMALAEPGTRPVVPNHAPRAEMSAIGGRPPIAARAVLEDREGDIWVGTESGIDRFRSTNIVRAVAVSDKPGVAQPEREFSHYQLWKDGRNRIFARNGETIYRLAQDGAPIHLADHVSPDVTVCAAKGGGLWLRARPDRLDRIGLAGARPVPLPAGFPSMATYSSCLEDASGALWLAFWNTAIFRYVNGRWERYPMQPPVRTEPALEMAQDHPGGIITYAGDGWFARNSSGATTRWFRGPSFVRFINIPYTTTDGLMLGSEAALIAFDGRSFHALPAKRFPFLRDVSDIVQTAHGDTWLMTTPGVIRIPTRSLAAAFRDPAAKLNPAVFDAASGFSGTPEESLVASMFEDAHGVIWFTTSTGVFRLNPARIVRNLVPPIVLIRSVVAGKSAYAPANVLTLPKGLARLQFGYTATTLAVPERTRFVYRLAGVDPGWIDAGSRRDAFYTNLAPGRYRFDVAAINEDGVWSERPASVVFDIPPTFLQSRWFIALCVALGAGLLWLLYRLRLHQVTTKLRGSMEDRNAERERIARELHDTFLQSIQGLILQFQSIIYGMPEGAESRRVMEASLEQARGLVADGRDRVSALRARTGRTDLPRMLEEAAERLVQGGGIGITTIVTGDVWPLDPGACDEINMICDEALFNAAQHARANRVTITLEYTRRSLTVTIADDGVGIEPGLLQHGRKGHFGLVGMRERAGRLGASLAINSAQGQGTRIILTIPSHAAHQHGSIWRPWGRRPNVADDKSGLR